nr:immunoglobulin heavy chain junction region [Macaca mulatta]MOY17879.1 immunoglobulin heavy chain junction region [Macaca mulatta]MOY17912.1 immunoglobulin heavy chain junction region [Macaca mulatta]MOY17945.1 immunoglobulin heavy chain junction region [Macaca mulatta]MOY17979.1 immunoglobulin heavy chain junction region [Macaca mulatta]
CVRDGFGGGLDYW